MVPVPDSDPDAEGGFQRLFEPGLACCKDSQGFLVRPTYNVLLPHALQNNKQRRGSNATGTAHTLSRCITLHDFRCNQLVPPKKCKHADLQNAGVTPKKQYQPVKQVRVFMSAHVFARFSASV